MIFQRASADLDAKATLELGRALGVISEEDYAVATVLDGLNKATASTDPGAYAAQVKAIADAIDRLHNKNITVTLTTIQQEINSGGVAPGGGGTGGGSGAPSNIPGGPADYGYAAGVTNFTVPPGYPNDSFNVGLTSGEILNVLPAGQKGGEGIVVNVPLAVYGDADPAMVQRAAYDGANRGTLAAMRERGMR